MAHGSSSKAPSGAWKPRFRSSVQRFQSWKYPIRKDGPTDRNTSFTAANAGSGLMNLGTLGALFAFSIYLQQQEGESPIEAGLHILPWTAGLAIFAIVGGRIAQRVGPRLPAGLGLAATGIAFVVVALLPSQSGPAALVALSNRWNLESPLARVVEAMTSR